MPNMSRASRATLRSQSGPQAAAWLTTVPTSPATTLPPVLMQICLRRRLRLPLMLSNRRCEGCEAVLDDLGDHRAACPVSGRLRRRAKPMELAWSAIFAEAGAVVADQVLLRDTNIEGIASGDRRQIDFVAWGVRGFSRPICGDATLSLHCTAMEHLTHSHPTSMAQVSYEPWHARRQPTRSWRGRTGMENLPCWLVKREEGGIIEHSQWLRNSSRRRRRRSYPYCGKQRPSRIIDDGGASSPWHSNARSLPAYWITPVWGTCPAQVRNPRSVTCWKSQWRSRRLAASHCGTIRMWWGLAANTQTSATRMG